MNGFNIFWDRQQTNLSHLITFKEFIDYNIIIVHQN
jgi:hypothetical protein